MKTIIYLGADHNGWQMKNELGDWLIEMGYEVQDMGPQEEDKTDDYPDYGFKVAEAVAKDPSHNKGILLCGSGVGMAVAADKVPGVRAALIHDPKIAEVAQRDDDINVLALGAWYINLATAKKVIIAWLKTSFSGEERHVRRVNKINAYEKNKSNHEG